jgi:heat shock protein HslJ
MNNHKSMSKRWPAMAALFLAGLILVTGCSETTTSKAAAAGSETIPPLTYETLKNAAYRGIYAEAVQLTDGHYEGEPFVQGGASRPTVTFTDAYDLDDLNGDGLDDAVVVLVENSGGSGNFRYLAVVLNRDGNPENVATQSLGDRVQIQSVTIDGTEITVKAVAHGPDDPMCCPTQEVTLTYSFDGEQLVKVSEETAAAEAEIIDITWQWAELIETEPASQSLVPDPENYTLVLLSDGTYQVQADCNVGSGAYRLEGNKLTLLPGPMTLAECEPDSLYDLYLTTLGSVESLSIEDGRLILHLRGDAGRMVLRDAGLAGETDSGAVGADITGSVWTWEETTTPTSVTSVDDPAKYTIELLPDGQFRVSADCNTGRGSYTMGDGHVNFEFGPMTLAECEPGSLSDQFIQELSAAAIYFLEGEELFIDLKFDSGTMRFAPGR